MNRGTIPGFGSVRGMKRILALTSFAAAFGTASTAHAELERYALGMFHFNVQYVAGGLVGFPGSTVGDVRPEEVEDLIITESLVPVLEMYAAHPMWGTNIEMQGYLLDVLAARHPETLDLLRDMALSGQIEVVSFHYSDQLFIAYPEVDWERSQALTVATFEEHGVPLGTSVFCQEGQAGEGLAGRLAERGYQTMVWPKNLWIFQHGDLQAEPLYEFGDVFLVPGGQGASYDDGDLQVETTWTFFDDGELLATDDWNPYFPEFFVHVPEAVAEYEADLQALEDDGWIIASVADYTEALRDRLDMMPAPPLFDGTWQPSSTNGVGKWLGDRSIWALTGAPHDRDNHVRSLNYVAHRELVAAETAADVAGLDAREELDAAWRLLAMGEVTDASGINPYRGEVEYGLAHSTEVLRIARGVIERAKEEEGHEGPVTIDPRAGSMVQGEDPPFVGGRSSDPPLPVDVVVDDPARQPELTWEELGSGHWRGTFTVGPGEVEEDREMAITFHGELVDQVVTTRALQDGETHTYRRSDFMFNSFRMALPLGLLSLGPDLYLIKDTGHVHVAATIQRESGDVTFRDETLAIDEGGAWVFHLFEGTADDALTLAHQINSERTVVR